MELFEWWNLIFVIPVLLAIIYTLIMAISGLGTDHDIDGGLDHDIDGGLDHDIDGGLDHGLGHLGHEHTAEGGFYDKGVLIGILSFLGLGKIPLSIILVGFLITWGVTGWISNTLFKNLINSPIIFIWPSIIFALIVAIFLTKYLALGLSKIFPSMESYAITSYDLVAKSGEVCYPISITEEFGRVQVRDKYGNLHTVDGRISAGEQPILPGTKVYLTLYDPVNKAYQVIPESSLNKELGRS